MSADVLNPSKRKASCFCNHCKNPFSRRELDGRFLCQTCRSIPGVTGFQDPSTRGLRSGSPEYWEKTKDQLRIIGEDDGAPEPATRNTASTGSPTQRTSLRDWQLAMLADAELDAEVKVALMRLSMFANWKTGERCWPSYARLASAIGRTQKQVRNLLKEGVSHGWITVEHRRLRGKGQTSNQYRFLIACREKPPALGESEGGQGPCPKA